MSLTQDLGIVDSVSKAQRMISSQHAHIHEGEAFQADYEFLAVADAASVYTLLAAPAAGWIHLRNYLINASVSPVKLELFEAPTVSADGTAVTGYNRNRNIATAPTLVVTHTPTLSADGVLLDPHHIRATAGKQAGGGDTTSEPEWVLALSTKYLVKATNNSGEVADIAFSFFWYE